MKQTRWLTETKAIADQAAVNGSIYYIMPTGDYTEFEELDEGYVVVSAMEIKRLCKKYFDENFKTLPDDYSVGDYIADECIYATDDSIEASLEPEREEVEHYLDDYYTDSYQRDMPTGDSTIGLLFYAKVNPSWSEAVENLLNQIRESELAKTRGSTYQYVVKAAINRQIEEVYQQGINWAYECWEGNVQDDYPWIEQMGRVGRNGGHIKLVAHWPETTMELAEIARDCDKIKCSIDAEVKWLESDQCQLTEYRAAFDIYEEERKTIAA